MGVVFGARHEQLGELVAIKFMSSEGAKDARASERFLREARASLKIKGEHVVRILDVGTENDIPYLVMEHLDGIDLSTLIADQGPLSVSEAVLYILQACEALAEAHSHGIVHRDLKPSNLFLSRRPDGSPLIKVLDFGIAKAATEQAAQGPSLTDTHAVFGSPAYMSPEQIRSAKHVDSRTDLWALGIVLYELLTGKHPFSGETSAAVLASVSADTPTPLRAVRADIPRDLAAAVERCLVKDPTQRMPSVVDLATALEPFAPQGQISTDRIRRLSKMPPSARDSGPQLLPKAKVGAATGSPWSTTAQPGAPMRKRALVGLTVFAIGAAAGVTGLAISRKQPPQPIPVATTAPAPATRFGTDVPAEPPSTPTTPTEAKPPGIVTPAAAATLVEKTAPPETGNRRRPRDRGKPGAPAAPVPAAPVSVVAPTPTPPPEMAPAPPPPPPPPAPSAKPKLAPEADWK